MNCYIDAFKNYVNFKGRATRKEYWMFVLFNLIVSFVIAFVADLFHIYFLNSLYSLIVLCPWIALFVRRMHDVGKSGAWFFVAFIPVIGIIWVLITLCEDSKLGPNQYGPNPKEF